MEVLDFHVITPAGSCLVMQTRSGRVVNVWPAPAESCPSRKRTGEATGDDRGLEERDAPLAV
jgi:hypothetical protein